MNQKTIRSTKRNARKQIKGIERIEKSKLACKQILTLPEYKNAKKIACFLSLPEEISTELLIKQSYIDKKVYLPVVIKRGEPLVFAPYHAQSKMTVDSQNIPIPDVLQSEYVLAEQLDLVIMPLVAFDQHCQRIGMGGGYYDKTFAFLKNNSSPRLVGIAYEAQKTEQAIISQPWDIHPHIIITESSKYTKNDASIT